MPLSGYVRHLVEGTPKIYQHLYSNNCGGKIWQDHWPIFNVLPVAVAQRTDRSSPRVAPIRRGGPFMSASPGPPKGLPGIQGAVPRTRDQSAHTYKRTRHPRGKWHCLVTCAATAGHSPRLSCPWSSFRFNYLNDSSVLGMDGLAWFRSCLWTAELRSAPACVKYNCCL